MIQFETFYRNCIYSKGFILFVGLKTAIIYFSFPVVKLTLNYEKLIR